MGNDVEYYVVIKPGGEFQYYWSFDGHLVKVINVEHPELNDNQHAHALPGQSAAEALVQKFPELFTGLNALRLEKLDLKPGNYFARMARPVIGGDRTSVYWGQNDEANAIAISAEQLLILISTLSNICRTIHPEAANLDTYGHETRNLLIIAATEVEAQMRGVLKGNGYTGRKGDSRFTTDDYVKLLAAMRLDGYAVRFASYPWLNQFKPFLGWKASRATKSLPWYDAYNGVKHDRESQFARAKLSFAFDAVAAAFAMFAAQYGSPHYESLSMQGIYNVLLVESPQWEISKRYIGPERDFSAPPSAPALLTKIHYQF
jgi:hypothetical protein